MVVPLLLDKFASYRSSSIGLLSWNANVENKKSVMCRLQLLCKEAGTP